MTYEQSYQNLEKIRSLIPTYTGGYVYFDFKNDSEFNVFRYDEITEEIHSFYVRKTYGYVLPFARIALDSEGGYLRYSDKNISFMLELKTGASSFRDRKAPIDKDAVRESYAQLLVELKKL